MRNALHRLSCWSKCVTPRPLVTKKAEATRTSILDAAESCFAELGFGSTHLREIARRAGVTPPLILHYFGSKAELFEAVLLRVTIAYDARQQDQWALEATDPRFFRDALRVMFTWLGEMRTTGRLVNWARLEGRLPTLPEADAIFAKAKKRVRDAQQAGVVRADVDVETTLIAVEALFKGYWDRKGEFEERGASPERMLQLALQLFLHRLLTPNALAELEATAQTSRGSSES